MSDERLRDLERRFRATGSEEDEAAWLRARVQAGQLEPGRLELAARLGHRGAGGAAQQGGSLAAALEGFGREAATRAAVAAYWCAAAEEGPNAFAHVLRQAVVAVEAWLVSACEAHLEGVRSLSAEVGDIADGCAGEADAPYQAWRAVECTLRARPWAPEVEVAEVYEFGPACLACVRSELVAWALGYSDPVLERVLARQREAKAE